MIFKQLRILLLTLVALGGTIQTANAQAAIVALIFGDKVASEKFNISMEFGVNFAQFSNTIDTKQFQSRLNFGIAGNLMLSDNFFLSPTIYFVSKRALKLNSYSLNTGNPSLDNEFINKKANLDISYIDIPILLSYQTNNKKFRFGIGPQISFLKSSRLEVNGDDGKFNKDFKPENE